MKYLKIKYRLVIYFTSLTVCSGDIKKALKMKKSLENDQSTGHFKSFFFCPPTLNLKKDSSKSTNKKKCGLCLLSISFS